jgi:tRNA(Ile)-lysidine synthase
VRRELLPAARALVNPSAEAALGRVAQAARSASRALERQAAALLRGSAREHGLDVEVLREADEAVLETAIARALRERLPEQLARVHVRAVARLARSPGHGAVALPAGLAAWVAGGALAIGPVAERPANPPTDAGGGGVEIPVPGRAAFAPAGLEFEARIQRDAGARSFTDDDPGSTAHFDLALARGRLGVRSRRPGDRFHPLGSSGTTTLKRFFIDRKVPRDQRARIPIVTLDDLPIWVLGERIDDRFKVTAATRDVLEVRAAPVPSSRRLS